MKKTAELFKILSVEKRLEIIDLLKTEDMSVNALAAALGISPSAVSQHLRILKNADIVTDERRGYWIFYSLNMPTMRMLQERLSTICKCGCMDVPPRRPGGTCNCGQAGPVRVK